MSTKPADNLKPWVLPSEPRVVTHAGMTRSTQTTIILLALIIAMALGFWMFQENQDASAIARGDYDACWTDHCKSRVLENDRHAHGYL